MPASPTVARLRGTIRAVVATPFILRAAWQARQRLPRLLYPGVLETVTRDADLAEGTILLRTRITIAGDVVTMAADALFTMPADQRNRLCRLHRTQLYGILDDLAALQRAVPHVLYTGISSGGVISGILSGIAGGFGVPGMGLQIGIAVSLVAWGGGTWWSPRLRSKLRHRVVALVAPEAITECRRRGEAALRGKAPRA